MVGKKVVSRLTAHILNPGLRTSKMLDLEEELQIREVPSSPCILSAWNCATQLDTHGM